MAGRIVFEDEEIRVVHRPGGSAFTLVTFGALGHRPKADWIWAEKPVARLGLEAIGFVAKRENWYPAAAMRAAAPLVRPLLRESAIGYGFSMGAYAVLKYGRLLGLSHGLAVSPQVSIDPQDVPQDTRFHRFHDRRLHRDMIVGAGETPAVTFVAADSYAPLDGMHLRHAAAMPGVGVIPLPFMQHAAIDRFTSTREIAALLALVLAGDAAALRAHLRRGRAGSAELHAWVARSAAVRGHLRAAERLWARAGALGMEAGRIGGIRALALRQRLLHLLRQQGREAALAFADTAIAGQEGAIGLAQLGEVFRGRGLTDQAETCFRRALEKAPKLAAARKGLAALDQAGAERKARLAVAAAEGRWAEVLDLARAIPPGEAQPRDANAVVAAALMAGRPEAADLAARFVIGAALPDARRIALAWRLDRAGFNAAAVAILDAMPDPGDARAEMRGHVAAMLGRAGRGPGGTQQQEARMRAPALECGAVAPRPAGVPFGPAAAPRRLDAAAVAIHPAPGTPGRFPEQVRAALESFAAAAARTLPPAVEVVDDVFVNRHGLVWDRDGRPVLAGSAAVPPESLAAMAGAPVIPEAAQAVAGSDDLHRWLTERLPSLAWRLNDADATMPLLIGDRAAPFMRESIALGALIPVPMVEAGDAVRVGRLFLGTQGLARLAHEAAYGGLAERLGMRAEAMAGPGIGTAPLYLSPRDRAMGHAEELEAALAAVGFDRIALAGLPLAERIARIRRAPMVVAPHGPDLALLLLARPGLRVLEILPATPDALERRSRFARLSMLAGHRHAIWLEAANPLTAQWRADVAGVMAVVRMMGEGRRPPPELALSRA